MKSQVLRFCRTCFEGTAASYGVARIEHLFYPWMPVRWDNLRLDVDRKDDRVTIPLFEQGAVVRTFDTPEFRGMTFYEVHARSIINRVPDASYVPFRWSINPYRGCSHACDYCMVGDTPILMANGRTKPIADVRVGDQICGTVRGDGSIQWKKYTRMDGTSGLTATFRLALADLEALRRAREYLMGFEVDSREFLFQAASKTRRELHAISSSGRVKVAVVEDLIAWPPKSSVEWSKGFLAGIFDAEGSYSRGVLRFSNTALDILGEIASALDRLGFASRLEVTGKPNGQCTIRVLGGIREALRFFHTVDPAITRKRSSEGRAIKSNARLRVTSIEPLGIDLPMYDITTGTGDFIANGVVSHNCFARKTHTYLDLDYGEDFDTKIVVKVNAPELLRKELAAPKWKGEHIAMGTNVDTYQRAEGRYRLMRGILEALRDFANPFSILTKGTLILRDLDLLVEALEVADVGTNLSVGSVDPELWRAVEPGTPSPTKRLEAVRKLNEAGIACGVLMAPIIPFLSDSDEAMEETVRAIAASGATHVMPIVLHLRKGGAREWWMRWLRQHRQDLVPEYRELYGDRAYAPKEFQQQIAERVHSLARRFRVGAAEGPRRARRIAAPAPEPEQLALPEPAQRAR